MRLLFDEQLSEALVRNLVDVFPGALHVRLLNRGGTPDPDVWELAREHGCVLVTKDGDFHRLSLLHGAPPKVVWLRIGNCATADIVRLLTLHAEDIQKFDAQSDATVLELGWVNDRPNMALHQTAVGAIMSCRWWTLALRGAEKRLHWIGMK